MSGISRIISAPVDCWCVFTVHIVDFHTPFQSLSTNQTRVCVEEEKKNPITNRDSNQNPHVERILLEVIPKRFTKLLQHPKRKLHTFVPLDPWRRALSSAAPLLQPGPDSPGMAFGIREQILLALHSLSATFLNPHLLDQICFVFLKKKM